MLGVRDKIFNPCIWKAPRRVRQMTKHAVVAMRVDSKLNLCKIHHAWKLYTDFKRVGKPRKGRY